MGPMMEKRNICITDVGGICKKYIVHHYLMIDNIFGWWM